jgi:hypothetical protein
MRRLQVFILAFLLSFPVMLHSQSTVTIPSYHQSKQRPAAHPRPEPEPRRERALTNVDVINMVKSGLAESTIMLDIQQSPSAFDVSANSLIDLKRQGIPDAIIQAMIGTVKKGTEQANAQPADQSAVLSTRPEHQAPSSPQLPSDIGVYLMQKGTLKEIEPEIVGWQTGGVLKTMATMGWDKGHINGKVMGSKSANRIENPVEFVIKTPEGTSATEYQLLQLYQKSNRREFRAVTGGVFHASGGAERTAIPFSAEKIQSRTWRIKLGNLSPGEYGFLPPGIAAASIGASGKMYSFSILE